MNPSRKLLKLFFFKENSENFNFVLDKQKYRLLSQNSACYNSYTLPLEGCF